MSRPVFGTYREAFTDYATARSASGMKSEVV
jgi:hypothetical protein